MKMDAGQPAETIRQRRQRETREALLEAAYASFCELGYAECSLDLIATRAGYTKGAVYAHFPSKEELFLALIDVRTASLMSGWAEATPAGASQEVLLHSLGQWLARTVATDLTWCLVNAEFALLAARKPALAERRRAGVDEAGEEIVSLLGPLLAGLPSDAEASRMARLVMALLNGLVLHAAIDPNVDLAHDFEVGLARLIGPTESDASRKRRVRGART